MEYNYGVFFQYREEKNGEKKTESIFFPSSDPNIENACEIEMLKYLTKYNYYSGKVLKTISC